MFLILEMSFQTPTQNNNLLETPQNNRFATTPVSLFHHDAPPNAPKKPSREIIQTENQTPLKSEKLPKNKNSIEVDQLLDDISISMRAQQFADQQMPDSKERIVNDLLAATAKLKYTNWQMPKLKF